VPRLCGLDDLTDVRSRPYASSVRRLRPLSEAECYTRCYGGWEQTVRLVTLGKPRREVSGRVLAGEEVRRLFEERLDRRRPAAA
jgi:hypothetical protein